MSCSSEFETSFFFQHAFGVVSPKQLNLTSTTSTDDRHHLLLTCVRYGWPGQLQESQLQKEVAYSNVNSLALCKSCASGDRGCLLTVPFFSSNSNEIHSHITNSEIGVRMRSHLKSTSSAYIYILCVCGGGGHHSVKITLSATVLHCFKFSVGTKYKQRCKYI